jgi:6-carboxyhexanoate--CoA ligase
MRNIFSIRMRASKTRGKKNTKSRGIHISGAEGLYAKSEVQKTVSKYIGRAMAHPKGKADHIVVTIEEMKQRPGMIPVLPVTTVSCSSSSRAGDTVKKILYSLGISEIAVASALALLRKGNMRGASLVTSEKGERLEPDQERGIRVSRIGIDNKTRKVLAARLSRQGINTDTVKEALILASKVVSAKDIVAELCISDDPDYTTGYVASGKYGYLRIPNMKRKGTKSGGRAFFVKEGTQTEAIINYLEKVPVIVRKVSCCRGVKPIDGIVDCSHQ